MVKSLIFDLGGVLIDWNPEYVFRHVIPDEGRRAWFFEHVATSDWNVEQDAGRSLADGTELLVRQWPDWEHEIRAFYGRWEEMLGGPIHETVDLLAELRKGGRHRLLALTNWSAETFPVALDRFEFLHWFEGIVVSGTERTRKPFPEIYRIVLERYGVAPEQALFIDDNRDNVAGAEAAGIRSVHFTGADALRRELERLGVLEAGR
jgi:2-haloacid dehalogenase